MPFAVILRHQNTKQTSALHASMGKLNEMFARKFHFRKGKCVRRKKIDKLTRSKLRAHWKPAHSHGKHKTAVYSASAYDVGIENVRIACNHAGLVIKMWFACCGSSACIICALNDKFYAIICIRIRFISSANTSFFSCSCSLSLRLARCSFMATSVILICILATRRRRQPTRYFIETCHPHCVTVFNAKVDRMSTLHAFHLFVLSISLCTFNTNMHV